MSRWIVLTLLAGCYAPTVSTGAPCSDTSECPIGQACVGDSCGGTVPVVDAPTPPGDASVDALADAATDGPQLVNLVISGNEVSDTSIADYAPTTNFGMIDHFSVDDGEVGLVRWDVSAIPTTAVVVSAVATVHTTDRAGPGTVTVHRVAEAWLGLEATWNERKTAVPWTTVGAGPPSSDMNPLTSFTPGQPDTDYAIPLPTALIAAWIGDADQNHGLVFRRGTSVAHIHIRTRDGGGAAQLAIEYYVP